MYVCTYLVGEVLLLGAGGQLGGGLLAVPLAVVCVLHRQRLHVESHNTVYIHTHTYIIMLKQTQSHRRGSSKHSSPMGIVIHGVVLEDDVDVVVDVCVRSLHVSNGVAHILGGYKVVSVHNGSGGQIVHNPVVVVLPAKD